MNQPKLVVLKTPKQECAEDIIRSAEEMLSRAQSGEFDGLVVVATRPDGDFVTIGCMSSTMRMVGALMIAAHDAMKKDA